MNTLLKDVFTCLSLMMLALLLFASLSHGAPLQASTSLTVLNITSWKAPHPNDRKFATFPVKSKLWGVKITKTKLSWKCLPSFSGLLWEFYTEDNGKTYQAWAWDYVRPSVPWKPLHNGYAKGWIGTAVGSCNDCEGYPQRSTIYFTNSYH